MRSSACGRWAAVRAQLSTPFRKYDLVFWSNPSLTVGAPIRAATVRSCKKMRPQAGVGRLKPAPPMQANDLPLVAQALPPTNYIFSHLLRERSFDTSP